MDSVDSLETWAAYELWTLREAAYLMSGLPPRSEVEFKADMHGEGPVAKAYRALKDATIAKSLDFTDVDGVLMRRRVRPSAAVAWAVKRGVLVPAALMSARGAVSEPAPGVFATAKASKATQAAEKVAREDGRLGECEAWGIVFDKASVNSLPYGVGAVAETLNITRQSLSTDVKAALRRRFDTARNGKG